ncbi:MAG: family 10 glycosylhydrolase [Verrucomicrobia bacterium]|nr:family 10 glycosylhydrolase [Verrucomicrobiota bacterium]
MATSLYRQIAVTAALALLCAGCAPTTTPPAPITLKPATQPPPQQSTIQPLPPFPTEPVPKFPHGQVEVPAPQGEIRGVWLHDPRGVNWDVVMRDLRSAGMNSIFVKFSTGGAAYYRSSVLPASTLAGRDEPALCLAAARRHGIHVHAWHVCFQMKDAPLDWQNRAIREGRVQLGSSGQTYRPSYNVPHLCPTHDVNREMEKRAMVELATKYPFAGVQLDHIRWSDAGLCYCATCKRTFARDAAVRLRSWPRDVQKGGPLEPAFAGWRERIITSLAQEITSAVRAANRTMKISSCVFPDLNAVRRDKGQNWKEWVDRGWIDFLCPMNYSTDPSRFTQWIAADRGWVNGRVPVVVGIGAYKMTSGQQLREQLALARRAGANGWILFNYDDNFRAKLLPALRQ